MKLRDYAMATAKMTHYVRGYLEAVDYYQDEFPNRTFSMNDKMADAYYHLCCATEILGGLSNIHELADIEFGGIGKEI